MSTVWHPIVTQSVNAVVVLDRYLESEFCRLLFYTFIDEIDFIAQVYTWNELEDFPPIFQTTPVRLVKTTNLYMSPNVNGLPR